MLMPSTVTAGMTALRKTCRRNSRRPNTPLDLAVVMYSARSTLSMLARRLRISPDDVVADSVPAAGRDHRQRHADQHGQHGGVDDQPHGGRQPPEDQPPGRH